MKKLLLAIFFIPFFFGCEDLPEAEVTFSINISGFNITADDFGTLKSAQNTEDCQHELRKASL